MTPVQKLRMKRFIKMLENLPAELKKTQIPNDGRVKRFNMNQWRCGTAACALGTAACHPYFNKQGLKVDTDLDGDYLSYRNPIFEGYEDERAGEKFFGITNEEAVRLFITGYVGPMQSVKPKQVAELARAILARYA